MKIIIGSSITEHATSDFKVVETFKNHPLNEDVEYFIINKDSSKDILSEIELIRSSSLAPIFLEKKIDIYEDLIDGEQLSIADMEATAETINEQLISIKKSLDYFDGEQLLLAFLLTRKKSKLDFIIDSALPQLARYPLAELFIKERPLALKVVLALFKKGYISIKQVLDEIQCCHKCQNGWITYKNTCPECKTVDINKTRFLHCFTCGNTEPEAEFLKLDVLICPRCNSKLSHIGVDYDRPLEEFVCNTNMHTFIEPEVISTCLSCQQKALPEELISLKLSSYQISNKGASFVINKDRITEIDLKDKDNFHEHTYFILFLNWMLHDSRRYQSTFSLVSINIKNHLDLIEQYGIVKTRQFLSEFFTVLRKQFRNTDIGLKVDDGSVVVLFVKADSSSIKYVYDNLNIFIENAKKEGLINVQLRLNSISSNEIDLDKYDAKLLLAELNSRKIND